MILDTLSKNNQYPGFRLQDSFKKLFSNTVLALFRYTCTLQNTTSKVEEISTLDIDTL